MEGGKKRTVVFITGAFVGNNCWDEWKMYFEAHGYATHAPAWPHKNDSPEVLRNSHPSAEIASNRLASLTDHYASYVATLDDAPVLVGHSIGGLIVQLLLQRSLGAAGVAIHSVPPSGIFTLNPSFLRAGWRALGFFTPVNKSYLMSFKTWQYAFTNGMDYQNQKSSYYNYAVPESKLVVRDTIGRAARIDFKKPHAPLLLTSGTDDHSIPAGLNHANFLKYRHSASITDYKEFPGRNHFVLGQPTWKEDADFILGWLARH